MAFKLRNCIRTCVDDSVRFVAFVEIIAAVALLVLGGRMVALDHILASGDWKHFEKCWFVYTLAIYAVGLILCGTLGMFGSSICKGLCLDLHALCTLLLASVELVFLCIYFLDRASLEKLGAKDQYGDFTKAIQWIENNQAPFIACMATIVSIQAVGFFLAWSVRLCCGSSMSSAKDSDCTDDDYHDYGYEYAPIQQTPYGSDRNNPFRFSEYSTPEAASSGRQSKYGASAPGSNQFQQALLNGTSPTPPPKI